MKKPEGAIRLEPHSPEMLKRFPWPVCRGCGLKNDRTRKAIRQGHWVYADEKATP